MSTSVSKTPLRQSMSGLHTWGGLIAGWALFVIFLTGSLGVFDEPITRWMQPEASQLKQQSEYDPGKPADRQQAATLAHKYLQQQVSDAVLWFVVLPDAEDPAIRVFWRDQALDLHEARLHPDTGEKLSADLNRETEGGHHFVHMHFEFHAGTLGIWIVGFFTLLMLVALVSGVIIHRRIFKDFFTFRAGKGQRSWLDAHNASGVLTLPFLLMITYTGLAVFISVYMPAAIFAHYDSPEAFFAEVQQRSAPREPSGEQADMLPLGEFVHRTEAGIDRPVGFLRVDYPGDSQAKTIGFGESNPENRYDRLIHPGSGVVEFDAVTGEQLHLEAPGVEPQGAAFRTQRAMRTLHFATFGGDVVRWLYFLLGLVGAAMIATGSLLFMVKRRQKSLNEFGQSTARIYRLVEILNITAISGLMIACISFFWINRLLPLELAERMSWEIRLFFLIWLLSLLHAAIRPVRDAWREQWSAFALLCLTLPVINLISTGQYFVSYLGEGQLQAAMVEIVAMFAGGLTLYCLRARGQRATRRSKVEWKVEQTR